MLRNPKRCDATAIDVDGAAGASGNGVCDTEGRCNGCGCSCDDPDLDAVEAAAVAVAVAGADADDCGEETETRRAGDLAYCG